MKIMEKHHNLFAFMIKFMTKYGLVFRNLLKHAYFLGLPYFQSH